MNRSRCVQIRLMIVLIILQLAFFIVYGLKALITNVNSLFQWPTFTTIVGCVLLIYVTSHPIERPLNAYYSWLLMWLVSFQFYFLILSADLGISTFFSDVTLDITNLPLLMLTIAFTINKGFFDLEFSLYFTIVGVIGFAGNQVVINLLKMADSGGLTVFLFGSIYGITHRLFMTPPYVLTEQLKMTGLQSMIGILFSLLFFPILSSFSDTYPSLAAFNIFMSSTCCILASLIMHLAMDRPLSLQTIFIASIAAAVTISPMPGIIQNAAAPAAVGAIIGILSVFVVNRQKSWGFNMPTYLLQMFMLPAFLGAVLNIIFIACYNIPTYNKIQNFKFPQFLEEPGTSSLRAFLSILSTTILGIASALVNIGLAYAFRWFMNVELLDPEFVMIQESNPLDDKRQEAS